MPDHIGRKKRRLETSWGYALGGVAPPTPYADYTSAGAKAVDNGWYEAYVEPNNGPDGWVTLRTTTGSVTIAAAPSQGSVTRARIFGPYNLTAAASGVGASMVQGCVFNSRGANSYGRAAFPTRSVTVASSKTVGLFIQGIEITADYIWLSSKETNQVLRRFANPAGSTLGAALAENLNCEAGLTGTYNHIGAMQRDGLGRIWAGLESYSAVTFSQRQTIAWFDEMTLVRQGAVSIAAALAAAGFPDYGVGSVSVNAAADEAYTIDFSRPDRFFVWGMAALLAGTATLKEIVPIGEIWGNVQGMKCDTATGSIYLLGSRVYGSSGGPVVGRVTRQGVGVSEWIFPAVTGEPEDIAFLGSQIITTVNDATSTLNYTDIPAPVTLGLGGWTGAADYAWRVGGLKLGSANPDYSVMVSTVATSLAALNTLFDNVSNANIHEGWIGTNGSVNGRIDLTRTFALGLTAGSPLAYGFAASSSGPNAGQEVLYANGSRRSTGTDATPTVWPANGDLGYWGAHPTNTKLTGSGRYAYAFSGIKTEAEMQSVEADPFIVWTPTNALTAGQKSQIASS